MQTCGGDSSHAHSGSHGGGRAPARPQQQQQRLVQCGACAAYAQGKPHGVGRGGRIRSLPNDPDEQEALQQEDQERRVPKNAWHLHHNQHPPYGRESY
jgi:hypothetical protein